MNHEEYTSETGSDTYPLVSRHLTPKFVKKAELELFETPEISRLKVEQMRELIRKDPGIEEEWFKDDSIISYLRSKKYDLDRAFASLKKMVAFVQKHHQYFQPPEPEVMEKVLEQKVFTILPRRDNGGCIIGLVQLGNWNTMETNVYEVVKCAMFLLMPHLTDPMTQVNGFKVIYDFNCGIMRYIRYCTPFYMNFIFRLMFECLPTRLKAIHVLNPNIIFKIMFSIMLAIVPEKITNRIHVHGDSAELSVALQPVLVPTKYGGRLSEEEINFDWRKQLYMPEYVSAIVENRKSSKSKRIDSQ